MNKSSNLYHVVVVILALGAPEASGYTLEPEDFNEKVSFDQRMPFDNEAEFDEGFTFDITQNEFQNTSMGNSDLNIVTWNVKDDSQSNYHTFRSNYIDDQTRIIVLQEVNNLIAMKSVFSDFPYQYITQNYTDLQWDWGCFCNKRKVNHIVVLSKLPIVEQQNKLIQTDPGGDHWRRHAQYVRIKVNSSANVHLFHYHNTYNWHNDNSQYEKLGMKIFKSWAESKLGSPLSSSSSNVFLAGDFNLYEADAEAVLGANLNYVHNNFVDYIVSTNHSASSSYIIPAASAGLSDHDGLLAGYNSLTSNIDNANSHVVRLYEHSSFAGAVVAFEAGDYPSIGNARGDFWNDRVSSLRWGDLLKIEAWDHNGYGGAKWCGPTMGSCTFSGFNDKISSFKIRYR